MEDRLVLFRIAARCSVEGIALTLGLPSASSWGLGYGPDDRLAADASMTGERIGETNPPRPWIALLEATDARCFARNDSIFATSPLARETLRPMLTDPTGERRCDPLRGGGGGRKLPWETSEVERGYGRGGRRIGGAETGG
jgi:hypothetical protein